MSFVMYYEYLQKMLNVHIHLYDITSYIFSTKSLFYKKKK